MPKLSQLYMSEDSRHLSPREGIYKLTVYPQAFKLTITRCRRKLKATKIKQKLFELEWKGERFFQGDQKRGEMNYVSLCWRRKLSNRFKFWLENSIGFFSKQLCL